MIQQVIHQEDCLYTDTYQFYNNILNSKLVVAVFLVVVGFLDVVGFVVVIGFVVADQLQYKV